MAVNFYGEVVEIIEGRGIYVEAMIGGKRARYGPMTYLSSTGEPVNFQPGHKVMFTNVGRIADAFIIVGKVVDPSAPGYFPPGPPVIP